MAVLCANAQPPTVGAFACAQEHNQPQVLLTARGRFLTIHILNQMQ